MRTCNIVRQALCKVCVLRIHDSWLWSFGRFTTILGNSVIGQIIIHFSHSMMSTGSVYNCEWGLSIGKVLLSKQYSIGDGKKSQATPVFPERLGEGRFLGAVSLSSMTSLAWFKLLNLNLLDLTCLTWTCLTKTFLISLSWLDLGKLLTWLAKPTCFTWLAKLTCLTDLFNWLALLTCFTDLLYWLSLLDLLNWLALLTCFTDFLYWLALLTFFTWLALLKNFT